MTKKNQIIQLLLLGLLAACHSETNSSLGGIQAKDRNAPLSIGTRSELEAKGAVCTPNPSGPVLCTWQQNGTSCRMSFDTNDALVTIACDVDGLTWSCNRPDQSYVCKWSDDEGCSSQYDVDGAFVNYSCDGNSNNNDNGNSDWDCIDKSDCAEDEICVDRQCVYEPQVECTDNSECDDWNNNTIDECIDSKCIHTYVYPNFPLSCDAHGPLDGADFGGDVQVGTTGYLGVRCTNTSSNTLYKDQMYILADDVTRFSIEDAPTLVPQWPLLPNQIYIFSVKYSPIRVEEDFGEVNIETHDEAGFRALTQVFFSYSSTK